MVRLGSIDEIDALFTDRQPMEALVEAMHAGDVELHVANAHQGDEAGLREEN